MFLPLISVFGNVWTILTLIISGLIIYFLWTFIKESIPALKGVGPVNISPLSIVLSILLILVINLLFAKIWIDLSRIEGSRGALQVIIYHTIFVGVVSIVAIFMLIINRGTKFGLLILPYFIVSLLFLFRVLGEICFFLIAEYKNVGVYVVIVLLIIVISILIILIQKSYESYKKRENHVQDAANKDRTSQRNDSLPPV